MTRNLARQNTESVGKFLEEVDTGQPFLLGLSGGIDSTTLGYLVSQRFGKKRLETFTLTGDWLDKTATDHAIDMASQISGKHRVVPIEGIYHPDLMRDATPENYAILLGQAITFVNNTSIPTHQSLISSNLQETAVELGNFGTYQGEISPTAHFFKSEMYAMGSELEVPQEVVERVPGSGILDTMTDEELIGVPYPKLEKYLLNVRIQDNGSKAFSLEYLTHDREGIRLMCDITKKQLEHLEYRLLHAARFWIREGPRPKREGVDAKTSTIAYKETNRAPLFRPQSYTISPGEKDLGIISVDDDEDAIRSYTQEESRRIRKTLKPKEIVMVGKGQKVNFAEHREDGIKVVSVHHGGYVKYGC
jgi:NAD+ synthase